MHDTNELPEPVADDAPTPEETTSDTVREPGTGLYDIVAVTHDGAAYCLECANPEYVDLCRENPRQIPYGGPIDRGTDWDCPGPSCDHCHRRITSVNILHYDGVCRSDWCPNQ